MIGNEEVVKVTPRVYPRTVGWNFKTMVKMMEFTIIVFIIIATIIHKKGLITVIKECCLDIISIVRWSLL